MVFIFYTVEDALSLGSRFIMFHVLTLKVALLTMLLQLSKFGLGSEADFSNTEARASTSSKCPPLFTCVKIDAVWMFGLN